MWLAKVAIALTEASGYSDEAEVAWLMKVCDPTASVETQEESGEPRFQGLDSMLATAPQARAKTDGLGRALAEKAVAALRNGKPTTGRHIANMTAEHLRLSDRMPKGDTP